LSTANDSDAGNQGDGRNRKQRAAANGFDRQTGGLRDRGSNRAADD
jgi:hypothetical protein